MGSQSALLGGKMTKTHITVKLVKNGVEIDSLSAYTMGRIKNRIHRLHPGRLNDSERFLTTVTYGPNAVNEFESHSKKELFEQLSIFCSADEVRFIKDYWGVK